ncbi:tetratricopeptide repeat protein [Streptosporangium lutulentum]
MLNALAVVSGRQRRHVEALAWYDAARKVFREFGARGGEAISLSYSARDHLFLGQPEEAITAAEQGLAILIELGSSPAIARARYHLGMVLSRVGRLNEAVHHHAECLAFFRASNQRVGAAGLFPAGRDVHRRGPVLRRDPSRRAGPDREPRDRAPVRRGAGAGGVRQGARGLGGAERSRDCLERAHAIFTMLGAPEADDLRALLDRDRGDESRIDRGQAERDHAGLELDRDQASS